MNKEHVDPSELNNHGKLPYKVVQVGTYVASNGMRIPIEYHYNENSLIRQLWEDEQARRTLREQAAIQHRDGIKVLQEGEILIEKPAIVKEIPDSK